MLLHCVFELLLLLLFAILVCACERGISFFFFLVDEVVFACALCRFFCLCLSFKFKHSIDNTNQWANVLPLIFFSANCYIAMIIQVALSAVAGKQHLMKYMNNRVGELCTVQYWLIIYSLYVFILKPNTVWAILGSLLLSRLRRSMCTKLLLLLLLVVWIVIVIIAIIVVCLCVCVCVWWLWEICLSVWVFE